MQPPRNTWRVGFLMADDGARFRVFSLDRSLEECVRNLPGPLRAHERCDYEVLDLVEHCKSVVRVRREAKGDLDRYRAFSHPQVLHAAGSELCLLAWVCRESGRRSLARDLLLEARRAYDRLESDREKTLVEVLAADLAHADIWRLVLAFGDPGVPYVELLRRTREHLRLYPDSKYHHSAEGMAKLLVRMVAEEGEHRGLADPAAELVWQLRHQNGQQWSQPGSCNVFFDPRGQDSPAHRLKAMGMDAVPALIAALDDPRYTRSVGFHRSSYFSHQVLRVGDAAAQVLGEITGVNFWQEDPAARKGDAERWWQEVRDRGLRAVMGQAVRAGDWTGASMGERLLRHSPQDALPDLLAGAGAAGSAHVHQAYHALIVQIPGEVATELLRRALHEDVHDRCRVTAAHALWQRGHEDEAVDAVVALWESMSVRGPERLEAEMVARFLATRGRRGAIEALARHRHRLNQDMLRDLEGDVTSFPSLSTPSHSHVAPPIEAEQGVEAAIEDLLVSLLDDTDECRGNFGGVVDARRCDFAARALSRRWPELSLPLRGSDGVAEPQDPRVAQRLARRAGSRPASGPTCARGAGRPARRGRRAVRGAGP